MDRERKNIMNKIKKLMAIASDPGASDQEVQLSTLKAKKLMIQHKINEYELFGETKDENVIREVLDIRSTGYCIWVLKTLAKHFRCKAFYIGKINTNQCRFGFYGLKDDLNIIIPIAEALLKYLDKKIKDLKKDYAVCGDFRVFKRSYLEGFAKGLEDVLNRALLEMKIEEKYEVAVLDVPMIVQDYYEKHINHKKSTISWTSFEVYELGKSDGKRYDVRQSDLLEAN